MSYKFRPNDVIPKRERAHKRYKRLRAELMFKLGNKCVVCGTSEDLEIHHKNPVYSRSRSNANSYFNPEGKELRCKKHHVHTESWRCKRKRQKRA